MTHYITRVQTYWCDYRNCLTSYEGQGYASEVWAEASKDGWRTSNGRHLCPHHSAAKRPARTIERSAS